MNHPPFLALFAGVSVAALSAPAFADPPPPAAPAPAPSVMVIHDPPLAPHQESMAPIGLMERRSTAAMVTGIVLMSVGAATMSVAAVSAMGDCFQDCGNPNVSRGLVIGGIVGIVAGIPLVIYGAKRVPASGEAALQTVLPAWAGAPGSAGWQWRF